MSFDAVSFAHLVEPCEDVAASVVDVAIEAHKQRPQLLVVKSEFIAELRDHSSVPYALSLSSRSRGALLR